MELPLHVENSKENYLYEKFEASPTSAMVDYGDAVDFRTFNETVTNAIKAGGSNPYCPTGYRTPNQRELAIMAYNLLYDGSNPKGSAGTIMCRTAFSFGNTKVGGSGKVPSKYGFCYHSMITLDGGGKANTTRCVRDIRVD